MAMRVVALGAMSNRALSALCGRCLRPLAQEGPGPDVLPGPTRGLHERLIMKLIEKSVV